MFGFNLLPNWAAFLVGLAVGLSGAAYVAYNIGVDHGQAKAVEAQAELLDVKDATIAALTKANIQLRAAMKAQQEASDAAYSAVSEQAQQAKDAYQTALAQLRKEQRENHAINPDMCVLSGTGRVLYDQATGASPAGDVPANSNSATGSNGSHTGPSQAPCVTLDNLQTGYLNLGQHDKVVTAKARAWPEWYARTFRGTAQ